MDEQTKYLFQLNSLKYTNITTKITVVAMFFHVFVHVDFGRSVFSTYDARYFNLIRFPSGRVSFKMFVKSFFDGTTIGTYLTPIFFPFVPTGKKKKLINSRQRDK